jgi:hypothetical protein
VSGGTPINLLWEPIRRKWQATPGAELVGLIEWMCAFTLGLALVFAFLLGLVEAGADFDFTFFRAGMMMEGSLNRFAQTEQSFHGVHQSSLPQKLRSIPSRIRDDWSNC